jgi:hypothetical protein
LFSTSDVDAAVTRFRAALNRYEDGPGNVTRTSPATLSALAQTVCRGLRDGDSPDEAGVLLTSYVGAAPFDESPQTAQAVAATAKIFCPNIN